LAPAEQAIKSLEAFSQRLAADLARETSTLADGISGLQDDVGTAKQTHTSSVSAAAADLESVERRLEATILNVAQAVKAEAETRSKQDDDLISSVATLKRAGETEVEARERADRHLAETLSALDATVVANEARREAGVVANAATCASIQAIAEAETARTAENFARTMDLVQQETEARNAAMASMQENIAKTLAAALDAEQQSRTELGKNLAEHWGTTLAKWGSSVQSDIVAAADKTRSEHEHLTAVQKAAEQAFTSTVAAHEATHERLAADLRTVETAAAVLRDELVAAERTQADDDARVRSELGAVDERIKVSEMTLAKIRQYLPIPFAQTTQA
jgi:hypothetical protein